VTLLKVENLSASYGNIQALKGIDFEVEQGEIVAIIGANGAGKTTLLACISGILPFHGIVAYRGVDLRTVGTDRIVEMGIVQVPEGRQIFPELSVMENLKMGAYSRKRGEDIQPDLDRAFQLFRRCWRWPAPSWQSRSSS